MTDPANLLNRLRYDGPVKHAEKWHAFARTYTGADGPFPVSEGAVEGLNLLNAAAFGQGGIARLLKDKVGGESQGQLRSRIGFIARSLSMLTQKKEDGYRPLNDAFNTALTRQWAKLKSQAGLQPTDTLTFERRKKLQALQTAPKGALLFSILVNLNASAIQGAVPTYIQSKAHKIHGTALMHHKANQLFIRSFYTFDPKGGRSFANYLIENISRFIARELYDQRQRERKASKSRLDDAETIEATGQNGEGEGRKGWREHRPIDMVLANELGGRAREVLNSLSARQRYVLGVDDDAKILVSGGFGVEEEEYVASPKETFVMSRSVERYERALARHRLRDGLDHPVSKADIKAAGVAQKWGLLIYRYRKQLGLSQEDLAAQCSRLLEESGAKFRLSPSGLEAMEAGIDKKAATPEMRRVLADLLILNNAHISIDKEDAALEEFEALFAGKCPPRGGWAARRAAAEAHAERAPESVMR